MYCLAVIMCQSCTSGMWGRVPGRLVWSRRLVCVYLTAPHSCVLSKCNRRRPHPSEGIPPPPFLLLSSSFSSPNFLFKCLYCEYVSKQARGRVGGQPVNRRVGPAFLSSQEGVHFSRSCLWASDPSSAHVGASWNRMWRRRCNPTRSKLTNGLFEGDFVMKWLLSVKRCSETRASLLWGSCLELESPGLFWLWPAFPPLSCFHAHHTVARR